MSGFRTDDASRLPQACIISAQNMEQSLETAYEMAAAAVCTGAGAKPCGACRACRKAQQRIHPDISELTRPTDDKGRLKREIVVGQIRDMASDAVILPNEAGRKVYIIKEADAMNAAAQNAALKLFEEPPAGVIFLLCTVNPQRLLATVRSRCAFHNCAGGGNEAESGGAALAAAYLKLVAGGDRAKLFKWCIENDGMDPRAAEEFIGCALDRATELLCGRKSAQGMDRADLMRLLGLLRRCAEYQKVNTGVKHIFGLLAVDSIAAGTKERTVN